MDHVKPHLATIGRVLHRIARGVAKAATQARAPQWGAQDNLPVAGLDSATAESIAYFLRQLPGQQADASVASLWIRTLQLAQILHDRLLHDLGIARRNLLFWQERLRAGSHKRFLLLNVGPVSFAKAVLSSAGVLEPFENATERIAHRIAFLQFQSAQLAEALAEVNLAAGEPGSRQG